MSLMFDSSIFHTCAHESVQDCLAEVYTLFLCSIKKALTHKFITLIFSFKQCAWFRDGFICVVLGISEHFKYINELLKSWGFQKCKNHDFWCQISCKWSVIEMHEQWYPVYWLLFAFVWDGLMRSSNTARLSQSVEVASMM